MVGRSAADFGDTLDGAGLPGLLRERDELVKKCFVRTREEDDL